MAKMSGGDVDVEPYLDSRNTKGYGTATQILKPRSSKSVGERNGPYGWAMRKWWRYAEVYVVYGGHRKQNLVKNGWKTGRWMEMLLPGVGCPGGRPDVRRPYVRALDPGTNGMNAAWRGQIRAKS